MITMRRKPDEASFVTVSTRKKIKISICVKYTLTIINIIVYGMDCCLANNIKVNSQANYTFTNHFHACLTYDKDFTTYTYFANS